jgi:hypothetical protein
LIIQKTSVERANLGVGITRIAPLQTFWKYRTHQDALLF